MNQGFAGGRSEIKKELALKTNFYPFFSFIHLVGGKNENGFVDRIAQIFFQSRLPIISTQTFISLFDPDYLPITQHGQTKGLLQNLFNRRLITLNNVIIESGTAFSQDILPNLMNHTFNTKSVFSGQQINRPVFFLFKILFDKVLKSGKSRTF